MVLSRMTSPTPGDMSRLILGPVRNGDSIVRLRPPRMSDFAQWREIRLRDRAVIEPYWGTSPLSWEQRHTPRHWARECLVAWSEMRAGHRYAGVIEVDGRFAGQAECFIIDAASATAESGGWIDARWAGRGVMAQVGVLLHDYMFSTRGVTRVLAPVSSDNRPALRCVRGLGYRHQATMALAYDAGGAPRDHTLSAITPADLAAQDLPALLPAESASVPAGSSSGGVSPAVVALAAARLVAWAAREHLRRYVPAEPVSLVVADHPDAVVRTLARTDRSDWRRAATAHRTRITVAVGPAEWERRHRRAGWYRARWYTRFGLRSPMGLRLVLHVNNCYAGEFRLSDSLLPGQATSLFTWADPDLADTELWAAALRAVTEYGFTELGLRRIAAEIPVGDTVTSAVVAAAGFAHEGVLTDHRGPTGLYTDHGLWGLT